jgi:NAD(P)H dehydrogenase (quinone)
MILITGATGQYGRATLDFLIRLGIPASHIKALVRDKSKAPDLERKGIIIEVGDYDDYPSLVSAVKDVEKLLLISGNDIMKRTRQHENVIRAAREASVRHILYTSFQRVNDTETSPIAMIAKAHVETEKLIKSSGMAYTILRNTLYADGLPMFLGEKVAETGVYFPAGNGKAAFALRKDMAEATAVILSGTGHENREYLFSNTECVSFADIAGMLSGIFGKSIGYANPSAEDFRNTLKKAGVPDILIGIQAGFGEAIRQGEFAATGNDLEKLLGRKPVSVKDCLTSIYSSL